MAFPDDPLDLRTELQIGGVWTDITADVYDRDGVKLTRGRADQSSKVDPSSAELTLNNKDGKYSPRNPRSPYYGKLGRNTPIRLSVPAADGDAYLDMDGTPDAASVADSARTGVTSFEVQFEGRGKWRDNADSPMMLVGKWGDTNAQRSWHLRLENQTILLQFAVGGTQTTGLFPVTGPTNLPSYIPDRCAFRAVYTSTGADTGKVDFYIADSINGPWTFLRTSSFSGLAGSGLNSTPDLNNAQPITIGPDQPDFPTGGAPRNSFVGRCYAVRTFVNGVQTHAVDFTPDSEGDTTDGAWAINTRIRKRDDRFVGEVSEWPLRWDLNNDVWTPIKASGILRRLGMSSTSSGSPLRRRITSPRFAPIAYWPLEDGSESTSGYSPVAGVQPLSATNVTWASDSTLAASEPLMQIQPASGKPCIVTGIIPSAGFKSGVGASWGIQWMFNQAQSTATAHQLMNIGTSGSAVETFGLHLSTSGPRIIGWDGEGNQVFDNTFAGWATLGAGPFGGWYKCEFWVTQTATNTVTWHFGIVNLNGGGVAPEGTFTGKIGRPVRLGSPTGGYHSEFAGTSLGHISVWPLSDTTAYDAAITGHSGETAMNRIARLTKEEDLPVFIDNVTDIDSQRMGVQPTTTILDILQDCADSDGALLTEVSDRLALNFRKRSHMYNQVPKLTLSYNAPGLGPSIEPIDDDTDITNDVTVTRRDGSSARAVLETGALSVSDPPDGIGRYDTSLTLSLAADSQAEAIAYWRLHLGTLDEPRYPRISLMLHKPGALDLHALGISTLREGDLIRLTDLPVWVASGPVDLLVEGWSETLESYGWEMELNCVPGSGWNYGRVDGTSATELPGSTDTTTDRVVDADSSTLETAVSAEATSVTVNGNGQLWVHEQDFSIRAYGEEMTVTAVAVPTVTDAFTRANQIGNWGASPLLGGLSWVAGNTGVPAAAYEIAGNTAYFNCDQARGQFLTQRLNVKMAPDVDIQSAIIVPAQPTGDDVHTFLCVRGDETLNDDITFARLTFSTTGTASLSLRTRVNGDETSLATGLPITGFAAGSGFSIRLQATGTTLRAKAWYAGQPEPDWTVTATSNVPVTDGYVGWRGYMSTSNTNVPPARIRVDNFNIKGDLQTLTVTRSNPSSLPAGSPVNVTNPPRAAL